MPPPAVENIFRNYKYAPVTKFPITSALHKGLPRTGVHRTKPNIVGPELCDDILKRLSPYLSRNTPVDVLDLWPGPGVLSSKVNDFLKPRRHVLIEPDLKYFRPHIESWSKGRSGCEVVQTQLYGLWDWQELLSKYLPEQGIQNSDNSGTLARNDTLLVLANPPGPRSHKDHFSGSRWIQVFMDECLQQSGLSAYGAVRLLVAMSSSDVYSVLPRAIAQRARPSLLTEQVALHAFEVASTVDEKIGTWAYHKDWEMITGGEQRVQERASKNNVVVPEGRAFPPIEPAPECPNLPTSALSSDGRSKRNIVHPYQPRPRTLQHDKYFTAFEELNKISPDSPKHKEAVKGLRKIISLMISENNQAYTRVQLADIQNKIDNLNKNISRYAASPQSQRSLKGVPDQVESLKASYEEIHSAIHFDTIRTLPLLRDNRRSAYHSHNFDEAVLLYDRRPFEPLLIDSNELYPRGIYRTLMYFEANPNPPAKRYLQQLDESQRELATRFFSAISYCLGVNGALTISNLMEKVLPAHTANDLVRAVPTLAIHASRRPKPNFEECPKTVHYDELGTMPREPVYGFQENLDYDLSDVSIRVLSSETIWSLAVEYAREGIHVDVVQLTRMLGGTTTSALSRDYRGESGDAKNKK
ncbi:uncharacterized protein DSM5745_03369 [Aspergillus mulundensis]|uniref:rRNA adenine N(6)-methyltransferase n=1 Tax=Aspergillus mulundensis TaxID=1810919 RepID=A0A3D8SK70_9EURO|nr:Uncharacterized protein DSM5745_03369 [Aspergillus mulundensis]RDW86727.1 Uncharacterized protein DSM5745_03369 [Aspergillus mulundensis]